MDTKYTFSIKTYAGIFLTIILVLFLVHGLFSFSTIESIRHDLKQNNQKVAANEISLAIETLHDQSQQQIKQYAQWEEIKQQLLNPNYYAYWHQHRALQNPKLPEGIKGVALYSANGQVLAKIDSNQLPYTISVDNNQSYYERKQEQIDLIIIEPITELRETLHTIGYVAARIAVYPELFKNYHFDYIDGKSIRLKEKLATKLARSELITSFSYNIKQNDFDQQLAKLKSSATTHVIIILLLTALLGYPSLKILISNPLQQISKHIDHLKRDNEHDPLPPFKSRFGVNELEKVRESLNAYHINLTEANTDLESKNQALDLLIHHDPLTGAGNRHAFEQQWQYLKENYSNGESIISLILYDIDYFKPFNDTYGHQIGDQVLKLVSQAIEENLPKGQKAFRLGGDEFASLHPNCDEAICTKIAEHCQHSISQISLSQLGVEEPIRLSIGITTIENPNAKAFAKMLWQADASMHAAKQPGHANIAHYSKALSKNSRGLRSSWMNNAVYQALDTGEGIEIFYQPIVTTEDQETKYFEALLRIRKDDELISPFYIFQLVSARRLEIEMDLNIFCAILGDLKQGKIPEGQGVSINVSGPGIVNARVIKALQSFVPLLDKYKIVIEITETSLITQIEKATENIEKLKAMGFIIALDDFGSGYSSLSYLATMPVDIVKFDISLVRCMNKENQQNIIKHLAVLIRETGHQLLAEGIEDADMHQKVVDLGFDFAQGYYYGRPEPLS